MNQSKFLPIRVLFLGIVMCLSLIMFMAALTWKHMRGLYFTTPHSYVRTSGVVTTSQWYYRGGKAPGYTFDIQYQYQVNDQLYRSDQVNFSYKGSKDVAYAQNYTRKYPVGRRVDVFYLPHDPAFSVLEPHNRGGDELKLVVLALAIATAIVYVIALISSRKAR